MITALGCCWLAGGYASSAPRHATPAPSPSASASGSPAPLPTATPEPPETAIPRLEAKLKANPNDKDSLAELAGYELQVGRFDQTLGLTQKLLSLGDKSAQVYYLDGVANENVGRIREATSDFEQASNLEPTNAQVLLTLTELYLRTNRATDAERVAKRATTFNKTDKRVFENYGLVLGQEGKFDEARAQFGAAAKLDPKDPQPLVLAARSYISQKAYALAGTEYDNALQLDPKNTDALLGKARLQATNHDVKGSIATYETLLADVPTDDAKAAVLVEEYTVYRDEKMNGEALASLKRAEQLYPKVGAVHIAYGDYDVSIARDQNAAEAEWKTALGLDRNNTEALTRLAQLSLARKRPDDAIGYVKRITEVTPGDPTAWYTLGQLYSQSRRYDGARDAFRRSFALQGTPQALAGLATADLQLHNYKECTRAFQAIDQRAIGLMKQYPTLFLAYGRCAEGNRDKAQARLAYTQIKPYLKPGTQLAADVDRALRRVSGNPPAAKAAKAAKPKPKSTAAPHV